MRKSNAGFTLIEALIVIAVSSILIAITLPLASFWLERADLSAAKGEMSHGFGKAISAALRNEQALSSAEPAAAMCISADNQLSVLQATSSALPNCAAGTGESIWSASLPDSITISNNGNDVSCLCFNPTGLLTNNSCASCNVESIVDLGIGSQLEFLHVR